MTAAPSIDLSGWLSEQLAQASPDLLRAMVQTFVEALMGAEADAVCGAAYGERSDGADQHPQRLPAPGLGHPGRHDRAWRSRSCGRARTSRTGCWSGAAAPRRRWSRWWPPAICWGVSTRRMEKLVETLGITRLSKSQVSEMAKDLDEQVEAFRTRPLDAGPVHVRGRRRAGAQGPRGRPHGERARPARDRGQRRGLPGDPRPARHLRRGRRRLAGVLPRPDRPRPDRGRAGHLRRAPRPGRGHRRHPARRGLAAVPHPLRRQPDVGHAEERVGLGQGAAALGL